jgi:hypothetical protein
VAIGVFCVGCILSKRLGQEQQVGRLRHSNWPRCGFSRLCSCRSFAGHLTSESRFNDSKGNPFRWFFVGQMAPVSCTLTVVRKIEHYKVLFFVPLEPSWSNYLRVGRSVLPS